MKKNLRVGLLTLAMLFFLVFSVTAPRWLVNPQRNINLLAEQADSPGEYHSVGGYLFIKPNSDYILTLYSGLEASMNPNEYVTISKTNSVYSIDLIQGPGADNIKSLRGHDAREFLRDNAIELDRVEQISQRR